MTISASRPTTAPPQSADGSETGGGLSRREALKLAGVALVAGLAVPQTFAAGSRRAKRVIVIGGGIGGLSCAYELMKRGHDVTVLEASGRAGGHVMTAHDPFADGLYADLGAEQCTDPGYEIYRGYVKEFGLTLLPYHRRDNIVRFIDKKPYTESALANKQVLSDFGFNQREIDYLSTHEWADLPLLYFGPYLNHFTDEYQPFGVGLDDLDGISVTEFLQRERASDAAIRFAGGKTSSALQRMWFFAVMKHRRRPLFSRNLFRIKGGNQRLTDTFAEKLGARLRLGCAVTAVEHDSNGVKVNYRDLEGEKDITGEYLVNAIPLPLFKRIPVTPEWPVEKRWVLDSVAYGMQSRIVFQCRTRFWKKDRIGPNMALDSSALYNVWECATEVKGERGILMASGQPGTTRAQALETYHQYYQGKSADIEQVYIKDWFREAWAPVCERHDFQVGQLAKFWPNIMQPHGRIHFCGAYADNAPHGMEAATRSANRVAREIDEIA